MNVGPSIYPCYYPGLGLLRKFQQYRRLPQDPPPSQGHHLEEELGRLTGKIVRRKFSIAAYIKVLYNVQDNLLCKIEGQDQEAARGQEEECVVCGTNRASMQTLPCSHQVCSTNTCSSECLIIRLCVENALSAQFRWLWLRSVCPSGVSCAEPRC